MAPAGAFKPTLQLRHQLSCSGITVDAAAYDTRRHHLLTYDSHALKPHTLRLFSLRREIRSTPLFDADHKPPPVPPPPPPPVPAKKGSKPVAAPPLPPEPTGDAVASTVLRCVFLFYAHALDVFVCAYSAFHALPSVELADAQPTGYSVVFVEPASLKKLVVYTGPRAHLLRCACLDEATGRLVLASRVAPSWPRTASTNRSRPSTVRVTTPSGGEDRSNVVEFLDISKRPFRRPISAISVASSRSSDAAAAADHVMLCVEKMNRATLWHSDVIECITGAPRLHVLFGSGVCVYEDDDGDDGGVGSQGNSIVLEWREGAEGRLALVRRIVHERDHITSVSSSPSGQWLFTGHASGLLKVWNMTRKTNPDDDDNPQTFAPAGDSASSHKSAVASIEVKSTSSTTGPKADSADSETAWLYTTERASGHVRHWRFSVSMVAATTTPPQLDFLGELNVDPSSCIRKVSKRRRKRGMLGDWTRTIPLCIAVQMGAYTDNLLVVTRGDMIHVVKIQALLQVVHDVPPGEEIFLLQSLPHRDGSVAVVCSSGSTSYHRLHISRMDPQSTKISAPQQHSLPAPTQLPSSASVRLTRLQVCTDGFQHAWIVCGWSSGIVEVYGEENGITKRIALLQDPRIDVDVTALAIVLDQAGISRNQSKDSKDVAADEIKCASGVMLNRRPYSGIATTRKSDVESSARFVVFAGTARGAIFGWNMKQPSLSDYSSTMFVLEAAVAVCHPPAHSAHVVDLVGISSQSVNLLSLGADGILKFWEVPSMRLTGHINAAASSGAGGTRLGMLCSCVQVLAGGKTIVVGYEDGALAAWQNSAVDEICEFLEVQVSGCHERRVTSIVGTKDVEFLTGSLDMTVVLWAVVPESNQVDELRFFELGGPVVDCCVIGSIVFVALRDEVCWFTLEEGAGSKEEYPVQQALETFCQDERRNEESSNAVHHVDDNPSPGTLQPEDNSPRSLPPTTSASSPQDESVISIPSVIVPGSLTTRESLPPYSRSGNSGSLEGWMTDQVNDSPVDREVISLYVRQYIATCGSSGTISAETLGHFLTVHHLPLGRRMRPDFLVRKHLHTRKIDPKTRLSAVEATELLLEIQRTAEPNGSTGTANVASKPSDVKTRQLSIKRLSEPRKKASRVSSEKPAEDRVAVVSYNILGEKSIKWVSTAVSNQEGSEVGATINGEGSSTADLSQLNSRETKRSRRHKGKPIKSVVTTPVVGLPDRELLQRMHVSPSFRPMWTSGFCWCGESHLVVQWDKGDADEADKKTHSVKCEKCGKWCHRVRLQRKGYTPHFTARTILGIIVDVYELMMEPAHRLLYMNDDESKGTESEVSIHAALWRLFQHKFGVQHIVETKLKLLFVSMCHLVREMDAVAVFGELLALFQRPNIDEQVPNKMAALCVITHSWLYAREMVVNGDPILGNSDSNVESSKATHWQFASLTNALFCAQEVLVYPLVSPGYLQNILVYMEDYAQRSPTKPIHDETMLTDDGDEGRWIEIHRLLRLLVGEWKQQATDLRTTERLLFSEPLAAAREPPGQDQPLRAVLEKLRLILSCFVFYDHERVGLAEVSDFEDILRRLKYLWPNEHLSEQEAAGAKRYQDSLTFENTILASRKRFADAQGDGRICYLDFWAMLYIVAVRTKSLLKFREIPSFCKDYKLEVSPDLQDMLRVYMQRSSALLLPHGFHTAKSSVDESTQHQHQRRIGGLYEGVYIVDQPNLTRTLSVQELLRHEPDTVNSGLFIDGSVPSMRQSASTTALDAYNSAALGSKLDDAAGKRSAEPVVVGVRPVGPTPKSTAFLKVSTLESSVNLGSGKRESETSSSLVNTDLTWPESHSTMSASASFEQTSSFGNVYIQFPNITPRRTRIDVSRTPLGSGQSVVGSITVGQDEEAEAWRQQFVKEHEDEVLERHLIHEEHKRRVTLKKEQASLLSVAVTAVAPAPPRHYGHSSPPKDRVSPSKMEVADSTGKSSVSTESSRRVESAKAQETSSVRVEEPVVIIPTIEKHTVRAPVHGLSTVETLTRHVIDERQPPRTTEFEPVVVSVVRRESIPEHSRDPASRERNLSADIDPTAKEVQITVPSAAVEPHHEAPVAMQPCVPLEEPVIPSPSPQPEEVAEKSDAVEAVADGEEGVKDNVGGSDNEVDDDVDRDDEDVEDDSGDEPSDDGVSNESEHESEQESVVKPVQQEPIDTALSAVQPARSIAEAPKNPLFEENQVVKLNRVEVSPASSPSEPASEVLVRPNEVVDAVVVKSEDTGANEVYRAPSESTGEAYLAPRPTAPSASPEVRIAVRAMTSSPSATVQATSTKSGAKAGTTEFRHQFKFSQQPKFKLSASIMSKRPRSKAWNPRDNSDSEASDEHGIRSSDDEDAYDESIAVEDMRLRLSRHSLAELRKEFGRKSSTTRAAGLAAMAFTPGGTRRRLGSTAGLDMNVISEAGPRRRGANNAVRLDEDAERALYGGRALSYLGEGIVFSAEAEALMQHKWSDFFETAEATMFSPLKDALQLREDAQRREEEIQSRLMKKRMEEQQQDNMRLQRNTTQAGLSKSSQDKLADATHEVVASFRARRMTREASLQIQQQLALGETVTGLLEQTNASQYFHFDYSPDANSGFSIITFKLHVLQGEADLFLSTQTMAPCSSDFMWRSAESGELPTTSSTPDHEGQKIVLFPHDIAHIIARGNGSRIRFYLAVVALAPSSTFTLGVMTSGQKAEPSRAIQTVDSLIAHFNQLSKTYEGQASRRMIMTAESNSSATRSSTSGSNTSGMSSVDRLRAFLASAASTGMESVEEEERVDDMPARSISRNDSSRTIRRVSQVDPVDEIRDQPGEANAQNVENDATELCDDGDDESTDDSSFQQLLESIGERSGQGLRKSRSFVLGGPTLAQREFLQDEEASYQEIKKRLSPARALLAPSTANTDTSISENLSAMDDGESAAISIVAERRLSAASSLALQQRLGAKVKRRLSPLKASNKPDHKTNSDSVSLRVARLEPKLVAYSLSALPPPKHPHKLLSTAAPSIAQVQDKKMRSKSLNA